jgi:hypothetical protein
MHSLVHEGKGRLIEIGVEVFYVLREPRRGEEPITGVIRAPSSPLSVGTYTLQAEDGRKIKLIVEELIYEQSARVRAVSGFFHQEQESDSAAHCDDNLAEKVCPSTRLAS